MVCPSALARGRGKEAVNLREQAIGQMALVDEGVGSVAAAFVSKRKALELGEDDQPQVWTGKADLPSSFQSVNPRHTEIEENEIRLFECSKLHRV